MSDHFHPWAGTFVPALFDQKIYTPKMSVDLGFDRLFIHSADPDQRGFLESYGYDILPKVRQNNR
ncbi:MAG: hypothetical protein H0W02_12495 [Ktedonobacteraceae bacterium]|nr:hypothetical protein [Ktedonobacteraceae bacterium]